MNVPAKLDKHYFGAKLSAVDEHRLKDIGCEIASCITSRYYKGVSADSDNVIIVIKEYEKSKTN